MVALKVRTGGSEWAGIISPFAAVCLLYSFLSGSYRFFPLFVTDSARQIDVACLEDPLIQIVIKGPSADRDLIGVDSEDMGKRLAT